MGFLVPRLIVRRDEGLKGLLLLAFRVLAAESLDAAGTIQDFLFSGKERMATGANFNVDVALMGRTGYEVITTGALNAHFVVSGMNGCLHGSLQTSLEKTDSTENGQNRQTEQPA